MLNDNKDEEYYEQKLRAELHDMERTSKRREEENNHSYRSGLITGVVWGIGIVFALILCANIISSKLNSGSAEKILNGSALSGSSKSSIIRQYIEKYFYEDVDEDNVTEGMYAGMLASLGDRYSVYYTKDNYKSMSDSSAGQYTGIGVTISQDVNTGAITISRVYKNSPAEISGIKSGDIIVAIDGEDVTAIDSDALISLVKGKEGSKVTMGVKRDGEDLEFEVERGEVEIDVVKYEMLENNIGYIALDQFTDNAVEQVGDAIDDLLSQGMERVIMDLRGNPGGNLTALEDILDYFLPKDKLLLYSMTKDGQKDEYYSKTDGIITDMPMCVLVNEKSASASEAFSGAIKSYDRGAIVGTQTFGKGIMQSIFALGDGTAIKLTIGKYYLPDGSNIHEVGITPDYEVELPETVTDIWSLPHKDDPQLIKAIEVVKGE